MIFFNNIIINGTESETCVYVFFVFRAIMIIIIWCEGRYFNDNHNKI